MNRSRMISPRWCLMAVAAIAIVGQGARAQDREPPAAQKEEMTSGVWLRTAPAGGKSIEATRSAATVGDSVVITARVADRDDAFAPKEARMHIVDAKSSDGRAEEDAAEVVVMNAEGKPRGVSLLGHDGLGRGAEVLVVGKLLEAGPGSPLVIRATGIHVVTPMMPTGFILSAAPTAARQVADAKKVAKKGEMVQVRGRIGGSKAPFVKGRAVFTLVGDGIKACSDKGDDHCTTPWDYCCDTKKDIAAQSATIQIVDASGKPLRLDVKGREGIKELSDVTIVGTAVVADGKSLVVNATGMFVNKP